MSDISNSIRLNDYMSSTLQTINNTMEQTIAIMQRLDTKLHTLGTGGGLGNMSNELSAVMSRVAMLEGMVTSIGTGAGPGAAMFNQLNAQLTVAQTRIAELEAQLAGLGDGPGNSTMLQQLNAQLIASQARITALEAQLAGLGNGGGGASNALLVQLNLQLRSAVMAVTQLTTALHGLNTGPNSGAAEQIQHLNTELTEARRRIEQLEREMEQLRNRAGRVNQQFGGWALRLTGIFSALQMIQMALMSIKSMTDLTDEFTGANARLNLINDGLRTQKELQQQVLDVANNTRSSYTATAALVARMGRSGQFRGDNEGAIRFADIVNKSLNISGASTSEAGSVVLQLSQAMSSGVLRGEEFNAVMENGSRLAEALSTELGVSVGGLRAMAMDGQLTADVVADAIMRAGETIDAEFEKMPRTFGQNMEVMRNTLGVWLADIAKAGGALGNLNALFTEFAEWLKSEDGSTFLDYIGIAIGFIVLMLTGLIDAAQMILPGITEVFAAIGWGIESAVTVLGFFVNLIWGALPAILILLAQYAGLWLAINGPMMIHNALVALSAAKTWLMVAAQTAWSAITLVVYRGQLMLNTALMLNPLGIIIALVLTVIAVFAAWALSTNGLRQTFSDVFGFIVDTVEKAINFVTDSINSVIRGFNAVGGFLGDVLGFNYKEVKEIEYRANFDDFKAAGQDLIENATFDDLKNKLMPNLDDLDIPMSGGMMPVTDIGTVDKVGKVGKIDDDVNIADEDMKMLMELAVQNRVNQINLTVQTAAPNITQNNVINTELDLQTAVNDMTTSVYDASQVTVDQDY